MKNITFIFGCPRAGTTLVWGMLKELNGTIPYRKNISTSVSNVYVNYESPILTLSNFLITAPDIMVFEKSPAHTLFFNKIRKDFPLSKIILVERNPVAIVNSLIQTKEDDFNFDLTEAIEYAKKYLNCVEEIRSLSNVHHIRYEDILSYFDNELIKIIDFLEVGQTNQDIKGIDKILNKNIVDDAYFRKGLVDSYKQELLPQEISTIEQELQNEINSYNNFWKL